jgi:hypothetical protein
MKKTVKIQGYLFGNDSEQGLRFVPKSQWELKAHPHQSTYIAKSRYVCKEGAKIYEKFHNFKGKRKLIEVTLRG